MLIKIYQRNNLSHFFSQKPGRDLENYFKKAVYE